MDTGWHVGIRAMLQCLHSIFWGAGHMEKPRSRRERPGEGGGGGGGEGGGWGPVMTCLNRMSRMLMAIVKSTPHFAFYCPGSMSPHSFQTNLRMACIHAGGSGA